jgi:hypothetical protein
MLTTYFWVVKCTSVSGMVTAEIWHTSSKYFILFAYYFYYANITLDILRCLNYI